MPKAFVAAEVSEELSRELTQISFVGIEFERVCVESHSMGEVAVAHYRDATGFRLSFIVAESLESEPAFKKGEALQLVYFSDDLRKDQHDGLYGTHKQPIDAFASWFLRWESERLTA